MALKLWFKERGRKAEQDFGKLSQRRVEDPIGGDEEGKAAIETELPVTPSAKIPETTTSSPIDLQEIGGPSEWEGDGGEQRPYAPD